MALAKAMTAADPEKMKQAAELMVECAAVTDSDPCEAAEKIGACLKDYGQKKGINFSL